LLIFGSGRYSIDRLIEKKDRLTPPIGGL
jgi:hypothetical protein